MRNPLSGEGQRRNPISRFTTSGKFGSMATESTPRAATPAAARRRKFRLVVRAGNGSWVPCSRDCSATALILQDKPEGEFRGRVSPKVITTKDTKSHEGKRASLPLRDPSCPLWFIAS